MNKLIELLKEIGGSEELVKQVSEELDRFTKGVYDKYDTLFNKKLERAKQICMEELDKEKSALARKVGTFLESKAAAMQQASARQRAIEESEAKSLLKRTKSLLEGIQLDDDGTSRNLHAMEKQAERLGKAVAALKEERNAWVKRANKANDIATKALKHSNLLEGRLKNAKKNLAESKKIAPKATTQQKKPAQARKPRKLDEGRKVPARGKTTRKPITEARKLQRKASAIDNIANQLD